MCAGLWGARRRTVSAPRPAFPKEVLALILESRIEARVVEINGDVPPVIAITFPVRSGISFTVSKLTAVFEKKPRSIVNYNMQLTTIKEVCRSCGETCAKFVVAF